MGLFSFFNRKNSANSLDSSGQTPTIGTHEIPEKVFIEKNNHTESDNQEKKSVGMEAGIKLLFDFLETNYEAKGYDDALINPDAMHLEQNVNAIKNDLERTIRKVKTFYEDFIRDINFHIASRSRSGMIDTVEELKVKKETAESHIGQVKEIDEQSKSNLGPGQGLVISYTRGFKNGLAAISHHNILRKNF